jgi:hypothetical protein
MEEPQYHGEVYPASPSWQETLTVDVLNGPPDGGIRYRIRMASWPDPEAHDPVAATDLCPADARSLAEHLVRAAELAEQAEPEIRAGIFGMRRLPTITLCGIRFLIDDRLRQLRNVESPDHFVDLDDPFGR